MPRPRPETDDDGFTLVEVLVAFLLLSVVMVASASMVIRAVQTTAGQSQRQAATALADQALDATRGVKTADLARGRTQSAIAALRTAGTTLVDTSIDDTTSADALAATTGTGTVAVPTTQTQQVGTTTYTVKTFIEACWTLETALVSGALPETCGPLKVTGARLTYRISAEVTWPRSTGYGCRGPSSSLCSYDTTTLRDATPRTTGFAEPIFPVTLSTPTLTSRNPSGTIPAASAGTMVLTGTNFQQGALVTESGTGGIGVVSLTATTATFVFTADIAAGTYQFVLTNPDGGRTNSLNVVIGISTPHITSLSGLGLSAGSACRVNVLCTFTLTGDGFFATATQQPVITDSVLVGVINYSVPVTNVLVTSPATVTFNALPLLSGVNILVNITLTNPDGGYAAYRGLLSIAP